MRRSACLVFLLAALVAAVPAYADENAPPGGAPVKSSPPGAVPPPSTPPASAAPSANSAPSGTAPSSTAPPPGAKAPAAPPPAAKPPGSVEKVAPEDAVAILGQRIFDKHGEAIGRLIDVLVDNNGLPVAAVIDFGGFMGVGNRRLAVHWSLLEFNPSDPEKKIVLNMTPDQIKAAPSYRSPSQPAAVVTPAAPPPASP